MSSELMKILGVIETSVDASVLEQLSSVFATYPVLIAVVVLAVLGIIHKLVKLICTAAVLLVLWLCIRGYLVA